MTETRRTELTVPEIEDSREMCFEQCKPYVYEPDDEPGTIVTEWPNGAIDIWWLETDTRTRQWPDGTTETATRREAARLPAPVANNGTARGRPVPKLIIVIGANGAGKSTWCRRHDDQLPEHFYNADAIADGLGAWNSPTNHRAARKLVDDRIERHLARNEDFGFESTYSGRSRPAIVESARGLGYETTAIFLGTRRPEINIERVAARVAARTGHDVPPAEIRRRWAACPQNVARTAHAIDRIHMLDNSGATTDAVIRIENGEEAAQAATTPDWARELTEQIEAALSRTGRASQD